MKHYTQKRWCIISRSELSQYMPDVITYNKKMCILTQNKHCRYHYYPVLYQKLDIPNVKSFPSPWTCTFWQCQDPEEHIPPQQVIGWLRHGLYRMKLLAEEEMIQNWWADDVFSLVQLHTTYINLLTLWYSFPRRNIRCPSRTTHGKF